VVDWDGTDQNNKAVNQGKYTVKIEASSEHGGHYNAKAVINCADAKALVAVAKTGAIDPSTVIYGPPAKP
jgi:hypothetical protein